MAQLAQLETFHRADPDNPVLACDLADALFAASLVGRAREMLTTLPPHTRADPRIRFREARCALLSGQLSEAAALLEALKDTSADGPVLRHDLAFVQLAMGKVDAASKSLEPFLADPTSPAAVYVLHARLLHWRGDYAGGLRAIDKALAHSPNDVDARGVQALLLLDQGDRDAAGTAAEDAMTRGDLQPEAAIVLGTLALWEQRAGEAETYFTKVLACQPESGRALLGLGQVRMLHGDFGAGRDALERAVASMPDHIGSWHALAWCQLLAGDVAAAQTSYRRALALDRSFGETHGGLAIVHALQSRAEEAEAEIKRARKLDPRGRSALYARALLHLSAGREEQARRSIAPLLATTAGDGDPLEILKRLHARMQGK